MLHGQFEVNLNLADSNAACVRYDNTARGLREASQQYALPWHREANANILCVFLQSASQQRVRQA